MIVAHILPGMTEGVSQRSPDQARGRKVTPRRVIAGVLIVLAVIFIVENREPVEIRLIVPLMTVPLWVALTGLFLVGCVAGWLLARRHASGR